MTFQQTGRTEPSRGGERGGFTIIEVVVALVMLAIVVSSLAALTFTLSKNTANVTGGALRNTVLMREVNRLSSTPFSNLTVGTTTTTETSAPYQHTRTVTITQPGTNLRLIKIIITPTNKYYTPDTVTFLRTNPTVTTALDS